MSAPVVVEVGTQSGQDQHEPGCADTSGSIAIAAGHSLAGDSGRDDLAGLVVGAGGKDSGIEGWLAVAVEVGIVQNLCTIVKGLAKVAQWNPYMQVNAGSL